MDDRDGDMTGVGRPARSEDVDAVAQTLAGAFFTDPVWGWAFPDLDRRHAQQAALWRLAVQGALDSGWVRTTAAHEAATLWIPPGRPELPPPYDAQLEPLMQELVGDRAPLLMEIFDRFDESHPTGEEHFYLSLLGTHPDHRGRGIGMRLLTEGLALIDATGMPAYLESTNDRNLSRYLSVGFEPYGSFTLPQGGPTVTTMWRPARRA
ncbi:MAG: GNAT family N-acetyltransferase [Acidimicrobiia bacterium]